MITSKNISRRDAILYLIGGALAAFSLQYPSAGFAANDSNFKHVYLNPKLRNQFFLFLKNVFHLYPEDDLHKLIFEQTQKLDSDKEIYQAIINGIPDLKSILSEIRYALPSLKKQKEIMCNQTLSLLDGQKQFSQYLEIGTTGRYYDRLKDNLKFTAKPIFINDAAPSYTPADIMERGRIRKMGDFVPLYGYEEISDQRVPDQSVDLLSVYIGFHHAPPDNRDRFMESCKRVLKKGGIMIVRDHDVSSIDMTHFVALAHDVFNAGFEVPWEKNQLEVRNFTSLAELEKIVTEKGFIKDDRRLLQPGDPTINTLIRFTKS